MVKTLVPDTGRASGGRQIKNIPKNVKNYLKDVDKFDFFLGGGGTEGF